MKTANDILKWIPAHDETSEDEPMWLKSDVVDAMKQYAAYAIKECALRAKGKIIDRKAFADKESILSLIDELK